MEVVKYLVTVGANIHAAEDISLRWAMKEARHEVVKYLLDMGANPNSSNFRNSRRDIDQYLESLHAY